MSINNREDANRYYQLVNELVDDYMNKSKIRPSNLKRYLQPGSERFNKFISRNNLKDVSGIERVLEDVIDDRVNMEVDGVLTFENFKYFESDEFKVSSLKQCLYKGIEKSDINMEKILADVFDTNIGSIDIIDTERHLFDINDWNGKNIEVLIYSLEELKVIEGNIFDYLYNELCKKDIELTSNIRVKLSDLVKRDIFEDKMYGIFKINEDGNTPDFLIKLISDLTNMSYHKSFNNYFIWVENMQHHDIYK